MMTRATLTVGLAALCAVPALADAPPIDALAAELAARCDDAVVSESGRRRRRGRCLRRGSDCERLQHVRASEVRSRRDAPLGPVRSMAPAAVPMSPPTSRSHRSA